MSTPLTLVLGAKGKTGRRVAERVPQALGRPATDFRETLRRAAMAGAWAA